MSRRIPGWAAALAFAAVLLAPASADEKQPAGKQVEKTFEKEVTVKVKLHYLLYLPKDYDKKKEWPLLLFLHGAGETGTDVNKVKKHGPPKLIAAGKDFPFIVVSPQATPGRRFGWDAGILNGLLDDLVKNYKADKDRIYVTGLSMGGFGTWALAASKPDRFAAIAPICGGGNPADAEKLKNLPIWVFHGGKDRAVPVKFSEAMVKALEKAGAKNVKFTLYPNADHDSWTESYNNPELYKWFLSHKRGAPKKEPQPKDGKPKQKEPTATPANTLKVLKDFKAELLYSVPKDKQGSWVNLCVDPKGRIITSDQYGPLYRITPPPIGGNVDDTRVEKLDLPLGGAHGLLWAFDSLYVMVNEGVKIGGVSLKRGLHRVRSKDGGDTFEKPEFLHPVQGGGEHGCHAIVVGPDRKSLYIVCGNMTKMMNPLAASRVPRLWGEDHLLPRMPDGNGFMAGVLGPGGCIYKVDPDGKNWELVSTGYRNPFDVAFNRDGELFTYDADMEWDMNTPWYRPTRVCLVASGSDFGWRNGAGKWPVYYPDTLPPVYNVGPGSPTGMCFGYGTRFPVKYQEALFMCDWSYGKLYALHLTPDGSSYKGEAEEFINGSPLPLTDVVVNPKDGALYFTIGGRKTQSGLYRVTWTGKNPGKAADSDAGRKLRELRHSLEAFHGKQDANAVPTAWPDLGHEDRFIRSAARIAIEHQDPKTWQKLALNEKEPARALAALLALVRAVGQDPFHHPRKPGDPIPGAALKGPILEALDQLEWSKLTDTQRLELLRIYAILFNRMGKPDETAAKKLSIRLDAHYPAKGRELNAELCQTLVYLEAPGVAGKTLTLLAAAPTQEEQMEYAKSLRVLKSGWTPAQRKAYFTWYLRATNFKGGSSFQGFLRIMKKDAVATLTPKEKEDLKPILEAKPLKPAPIIGKTRPFVKQWKLDELVPIVEKGLTKRDFDRGRRLFGEANCFACHRFDNEGGSTGPDLTGAGGRFNVRDLLESVIDPSKEISDQYVAVIITTLDGKQVTGRIANYAGDTMMVMTNMLDPGSLVNVNAKKVESIEKSKVSMMPTGLLDTLKEDEILDLVAYLLSRGDRNSRMFKK